MPSDLLNSAIFYVGIQFTFPKYDSPHQYYQSTRKIFITAQKIILSIIFKNYILKNTS